MLCACGVAEIPGDFLGYALWGLFWVCRAGILLGEWLRDEMTKDLWYWVFYVYGDIMYVGGGVDVVQIPITHYISAPIMWTTGMGTAASIVRLGRVRARGGRHKRYQELVFGMFMS